jgi:hypothetical protein
MSRGESTEMISTTFYIGWFYMRAVRDYLNDIIENKKWPVRYEESISFFENKFVLYGPQRDIMYIHYKVENYLKNLQI